MWPVGAPLRHSGRAPHHAACLAVDPELWDTGSEVEALGRRCSEAWGIFPDQGSTVCPASASRFLSTEPLRNFLKWIFLREDKATWVTGSEVHSPP